MYRIRLAIDISATPARVWRALCDPAEVAAWDRGVEGAVDAPADYPRPGHHVRWRNRSGPFRLLHDRPREVERERRLRSDLSMGPFRYDETYSLEPGEDGVTLTLTLEVRAALPLVGALVERAYLGPATRRAAAASLEALRQHCEAGGTSPE